MDYEMMKANKDSQYEIKGTDKYSYHVECINKAVPPGKPKEVEIRKWVAIFTSKKDFDMFEDNKKAAMVDESRVIHDPVLQRKMEIDAEVKAKKAADLQAKKDAKEAKEAAKKAAEK